jgi:tetratricopeptide (TPR) repeat protein
LTAALPPLCFVVMPFGKKPDGRGGSIEFDAVYERLIAPAIVKADLQPLRADQELVGGIVHKPMFERLILADYAVADLTTANANVFYELGVRHAVRPYSTVLIGADVGRIPFDLAPDRVLSYGLDPSGEPLASKEDIERLTAALRAARDSSTDSPVFQLIDDLPTPAIDREKTDVFRDQAAYSVSAKRRLADARGRGTEALKQAERDLGPLEDVEAGILVDLLLSYRAVKAWTEMIDLVERMPRPLAQTVLVREQLGFALNRAGRGEEAEKVLNALIDERGPSSETNGLLGRVYKDRWEGEKSKLAARGELDKAIETYRAGFEADMRDAYPGINAVTLMEIRDPGGDEQQRLAPVVRYAVERRLADGRADYWDFATKLELAVIARDETDATEAASKALASVREGWEPETTAGNLRLIREARAQRGEELAWADELEEELRKASSVP